MTCRLFGISGPGSVEQSTSAYPLPSTRGTPQIRAGKADSVVSDARPALRGYGCGAYILRSEPTQGDS